MPLKLMSGALTIGAKFENDKVVEFESIASSGTRTLMLFYCWFIEFGKLTFLVIDEFDAYYHHELSEKILSIIQSFDNMQSMVTTHNVTLLHTDCTRPDCAYAIENGNINNLCSLTKTGIKRGAQYRKIISCQ
ncbi:MAG: ATP-binding protein [Clostridiales bacterium]|nr:MAG: ATP-binding protein [Clostridiales bacterium]